MSELPAFYDPMSINEEDSDLEADARNDSGQQHIEWLRNRMDTEKPFPERSPLRRRDIQTTPSPELLGSYGPAIEKPKVAPN